MHASIQPGLPLYRQVRATLCLRGQSFHRFCADKGMTREWVYACLTGKAKGRRAQTVVRRVIRLLEIA